MIRFKIDLLDDYSNLRSTISIGKLPFYDAQPFFPVNRPITRFTAYILSLNPTTKEVDGAQSQIFPDSEDSLSSSISDLTVRPDDEPVCQCLASHVFKIIRSVDENGETTGFSVQLIEELDQSIELKTAIDNAKKSGNTAQLVISASMVSNADDAKFQAPEITQDDLNLKSLLKYLTQERILETGQWFGGRANSEIISIVKEQISLEEEDLAVTIENNSLIFRNDEAETIAEVSLDPISKGTDVKSISVANVGADFKGTPLVVRALIITLKDDSQSKIDLPDISGGDTTGLESQISVIENEITSLSFRINGLDDRIAHIENTPDTGGLSTVETEAPIEGDGSEDSPVKLQQRSISKDFLSPEVLATIKSGGQDAGEYRQTSELSKREIFHVPLQNFGFDSNGNPISDSALNTLLGDIVSIFRKDGHDVYLTSKGWTSDSSQRLRARSASNREIIGEFTFHDAETHGHNDRFYVVASRSGVDGGRPQLYRVDSNSRTLTPDSPGPPTPLNSSTSASWIDFVFTGGSNAVPGIVNIQALNGRDRAVNRRLAQGDYLSTNMSTIPNDARCFVPYKNGYLAAYNSGTEDTKLVFFIFPTLAGGINFINSNDITLKGIHDITSIEYDEDTNKFITTTANGINVLEFVNVPTLIGLEDTPDTYGQPGQKLTPNAGRSALIWADDEDTTLTIDALIETLDGATDTEKTRVREEINAATEGSGGGIVPEPTPEVDVFTSATVLTYSTAQLDAASVLYLNATLSPGGVNVHRMIPVSQIPRTSGGFVSIEFGADESSSGYGITGSIVLTATDTGATITAAFTGAANRVTGESLSLLKAILLPRIGGAGGGGGLAVKEGTEDPNGVIEEALSGNTFERSQNPRAGRGYILGQGVDPAGLFFFSASDNIASAATATVSPIQFTENGNNVPGFLFFNGSGVYIVAGNHANSVVQADFPSEITLIYSNGVRQTVPFSNIFSYNTNFGTGSNLVKPTAFYLGDDHIPDQVDGAIVGVELLESESNRRFYATSLGTITTTPGVVTGNVHDLYRQNNADGDLIALWIRRAGNWERIINLGEDEAVTFAFKQGTANPNTSPTDNPVDSTFERSVSTVAGSGYILGQDVTASGVLFGGSHVNVANPSTAVISPIQFTESGVDVPGFLHFNGSGVYIVAGDHNNTIAEADVPTEITLNLADGSTVTPTFNQIANFNVNFGNGLRTTKPVAFYTVAGGIPDQVDSALVGVDFPADESARKIYAKIARKTEILPSNARDLYRQDDSDGKLVRLWIRRENDWELVDLTGTTIGTRDPNSSIMEAQVPVPIYPEALTGLNWGIALGERVGEDSFADVRAENSALANPAEVRPAGFRVLDISGIVVPGIIVTVPRLPGIGFSVRDVFSPDLLPPTITVNGVVYTRTANRLGSIRDFGSILRSASEGNDGTIYIYSGSAAAPVDAAFTSFSSEPNPTGFSIEVISAPETTVIPAIPGIKGDEYFRSNTKQHYVHNGTLWGEAGNEGLLFDRISSINSVLGSHPDNLLDEVASWVPGLLDEAVGDLDTTKFISGSRVGDKNYALLSNRKVYELTTPSTALFTLNLALPGDPIGYCSAEVDTLNALDQIVPNMKQVIHIVLRKVTATDGTDTLFVDRYSADGSYSQSREVPNIDLLEDKADCLIEENTLHVMMQRKVETEIMGQDPVRYSAIQTHSFLFPQTLTHAPQTGDIQKRYVGGDEFKEFGGCDYYDGHAYLSLKVRSALASSDHYIIKALREHVPGSSAGSWINPTSPIADRSIPGFTEEGVGVIVWGNSDTIFITEDRAVQYSPVTGTLSTLVTRNRADLDVAEAKILQLEHETNGLLGALNAHTGVYQVDTSMRLQDFATQTGDDFSSGSSFVGVVHRKIDANNERITACIKKGNRLHIRGEHNFDISDFGTSSNRIIGFEQIGSSNNAAPALNVRGYIVVYESGLWAIFSPQGTQTGSATFVKDSNAFGGNAFKSITAQAVTANNSTYLWALADNGIATAAYIYRFTDNRIGFFNTANNLTSSIGNSNVIESGSEIAYYDDKIYSTTRGTSPSADTPYTTKVREVTESSFNRPNGLTAALSTTALNNTVPVPTLDFTNEIKDISVDGKDFTYTLDGISVRLTIGTTIETYRPTDTVLFNGAFSTSNVNNAWFRVQFTDNQLAKITEAGTTAELTIAIQYEEFNNTSLTATSTGNKAIAEFELPIVVFNNFLEAVNTPTATTNQFPIAGTHSKISNRVQHPDMARTQGRAIYVGKNQADYLLVATSDALGFRITKLHITLLE